ALQAGPAQEVEQHRLGLVVEVMPGRDRVEAPAPRARGEQAVALLAPGLLEAEAALFREGSHVDARDARGNAERAPELLDAGRVAVGRPAAKPVMHVEQLE